MFLIPTLLHTVHFHLRQQTTDTQTLTTCKTAIFLVTVTQLFIVSPTIHECVHYKTSGASAPVPTSTQERFVGLKCEECGKWCKSKAGLVAHHRVHDNDSVGIYLKWLTCTLLGDNEIKAQSRTKNCLDVWNHNAKQACSRSCPTVWTVAWAQSHLRNPPKLTPPYTDKQSLDSRSDWNIEHAGHRDLSCPSRVPATCKKRLTRSQNRKTVDCSPMNSFSDKLEHDELTGRKTCPRWTDRVNFVKYHTILPIHCSQLVVVHYIARQFADKPLRELISSAYPVAVPGFEPRTSDMRGERVTTTPPTHVGRIRIFKSEQANVFTRCRILSSLWFATKLRRILPRKAEETTSPPDNAFRSNVQVEKDICLTSLVVVQHNHGYHSCLKRRRIRHLAIQLAAVATDISRS
ncbi:hypothetical protein CLF_100242 [Clonorchis sinensis]|uniref:C2H2-type domain-containing protein n=1 Tax=Clonorchis sinensis TaxID=79923 RepID=G7Y308_CLOSI|nr:hypothetical protein CLF_100242 [Clonorchis sinensis]